VHFRVWAPDRRTVDVVIEGRVTPLVREASAAAAADGRGAGKRDERGYFSALVPGTGEDTRYKLRLDGADLYPDPVSRRQPEGPHGPSQVVDPSRFVWTDGSWGGVDLEGQVVYEMHVGTFTRQGTWKAAAVELERLRGVCSVIEMMPVAEFPGEFGWGYDGVDLFAPAHVYGSPDDLRAFVNRAHELGFGVILDVVYNHIGPDGNYLSKFAAGYFNENQKTDWGGAINFDAPGSAGAREFFIANAGYWIDEYHFDGLRLDATHAIFDRSSPHVLEEIGRRVRECARGRSTIVVAENEEQLAELVRPAEENARATEGARPKGYGLDGVWNDDLHHSAIVALTGQAEAYFSDHRGTPQEFVSAAKYGYLFQGQRYTWQNAKRGTSTRGVSPHRFVTFLENHDQVANTGGGKRLHARAHPGRLRALTAYMMLGPGTPMLFQGQEFGSDAPFLYFAHHTGELAEAVRKGRTEFLLQFPSARGVPVADPAAPSTFTESKLRFTDEGWHGETLALHRDLFALRRSDRTVRAQGRHGLDGAVLSASAFVLRLFGERDERDERGERGERGEREAHGDDRLLLVNLGPDLKLASAPEPLLASPDGGRWSLVWSSEEPRYGGDGATDPDTDEGWRIRAESAVLLAPSKAGDG
jgi:maltooligosyltrehalose trehalohydrolase